MADKMKMPFFHGVTDRMNDEGDMPKKSAAAGDGGAADGASAGDGLHHHEMHEDEGGGYHSKHTHPDGRVEHADHASYGEAVSHMHEMHGHSDAESKDEKPGRDPGDDFAGGGGMAENYGRAADCE